MHVKLTPTSATATTRSCRVWPSKVRRRMKKQLQANQAQATVSISMKFTSRAPAARTYSHASLISHRVLHQMGKLGAIFAATGVADVRRHFTVMNVRHGHTPNVSQRRACCTSTGCHPRFRLAAWRAELREHLPRACATDPRRARLQAVVLVWVGKADGD